MDHRITVFVGPASVSLGAGVCASLQISPAAYECRRFPDGEAQVEINESVRGRDAYLLQSTSPPVEQHLMELLLMADACRRAGAARLTAVIPYFGYARQDRRIHRRSLGARVAADVIGTARFDRVMLIDAHTPAIEGLFAAPLDHLTAVPVLARAAATAIRENSIVVAPDLGAVKLARAYANQLGVPMAFVHKTRLNGEAVEAHGVIGDVRGRLPLIVDDMLSTGGTIAAAIGALRTAGATAPMTVAVTHPLLVARARDVLQELPLAAVIASDSVTLETPPPAPLVIASLADLVATAIRRHHDDQSLADLRSSS
ncbi:MAG TPA: ribose-phosphate pyrophosphokinase [Vicinamibacterales bacterium]|nr:ribose-phosphate pyrophosphokinase [Vicinamibacterales bacterium]